MSSGGYSFYSLQTGLFDGSGGMQPTEREGWGNMEGIHDHRAWRVDLESGERVAYSSPEPTVSAHQRRSELAAEMLRLEVLQARPLRELALNAADAEALSRLASIDAQIAALRVRLEALAVEEVSAPPNSV